MAPRIPALFLCSPPPRGAPQAAAQIHALQALAFLFAVWFQIQHEIAGGVSEVILAVGMLGRPQLLMLSGIGLQAHLKKHGIRAVMDQQMVGQGVADNPVNSVFVPSTVPVALSLVQIVGVELLKCQQL